MMLFILLVGFPYPYCSSQDPPNEDPVAIFHIVNDENNLAFVTFEEVKVDASDSYDPENESLRYEWDWGDSTDIKKGMKSSHSYSEPGTYDITLRVEDGYGNVDTTTIQITVTEDEEWFPWGLCTLLLVVLIVSIIVYIYISTKKKKKKKQEEEEA